MCRIGRTDKTNKQTYANDSEGTDRYDLLSAQIIFMTGGLISTTTPVRYLIDMNLKKTRTPSIKRTIYQSFQTSFMDRILCSSHLTSDELDLTSNLQELYIDNVFTGSCGGMGCTRSP